MTFEAEIDVMPREELLDPEGKAVAGSMKTLHLNTIKEIRIGKHIKLMLEAEDEKQARESVEEACKKLLVNPVVEFYKFTIGRSTSDTDH